MMKNQPNSKKSSIYISPLSYEEVRMEIKAMLHAPVEFEDDDNLIELGLDSLRIMRMVNKWRRGGATVTFAELIAAPRLSDWWSLLKEDNTEFSITNAYQKVIEGHADVKGPFPLTDVQYAYWIGRRDDQPLGGVGCHAYLEIDGKAVEPKRLESSWRQLLMHHSMLRVRFLADGQQEVLNAPASKALLVHDLRLYPEGELTLQLKRIRDRLSHRRLAVEQGEVAGLELSLLPGGQTRIHFDIDLLVADVQSLHIILRDLAAAYARGCRPAAPINWSFAQYLKQEVQRRALDKKAAGLYWKQRLSTLPAAPGLPLKEKPETIKTPVFKRRTYFVEGADWTLLQKRSAAHQVTPAMVLLTAYAEVLDRWSTNSRFLINIPLFDRQTGDTGIEDVVADFTNLLLLTVDCGSRQSFLDRARSIQAQFHEDVANAAYSGIQLQRDMAHIRQGEQNFAPVVFACNLGTPLINAECRETLGKLFFMISQTPQVWLDFQTYEMDGGLLLAWDTVDQLFPDRLIDQMFAAYTQLINWLVDENNKWQSSPDILSVYQQQRRHRDVELSRMQSSKCLHTSFFDFAVRSPQATALVEGCSNTYISYGELSQYALRVAAFLKEKGVKEGEPVAVTLPRGIGQITAVFGILAMGACYVPVSIGQPFARRDSIHKKAAIHYILTDHERAQSIEWPADTVVLNIAEAAATTPLATPVDIPPKRLAYIIFTSGSTGEPKGVEISHYGAWNTISDINRRYKVDSIDRILAVSSLDFDLSVYDIFGLLSVGGSLVLLTENTRRDAAHWLKLLDEYQVTIWNSVPVLLDMLLTAVESERQNNLPLRLTMLSGDWIGLDLPARLKSAAEHCHLVAMGGATEASIWSNYFDVTLPLPAHWTSIPYGRPLVNQAYRVVDEAGRDCPDWVAGELWIGGAGVAHGYRGDPKLTAERFVTWHGSRWYRTGDLGRYWPDGNIEFLGRKDFQVKIRGHRIELGEIEAALKQHPGVRDVVVTAAGDPRRNKHLVGYVVFNQENESPFFEIESAEPEKTKALWTALVNAGREQTWQALPQEIKPEDFPVFWEYMEHLSIRYICRALKKVGAFLKPDERYTLESLVQHCGIQPRYCALVKQWLAILEGEGLLKRDETDTFVSTRTLPTELSQTIKESRVYPAWENHTQGLLHYLQQIGQYSASLLKGGIDPLELFFSEELCLSPDDLMQTLPGADYTNSIAGKIMETVVQGLSRTEPIRVLEIGSRCGKLTKSLLSLLTPGEAIYTCTDHSTFFTNTAKNKFKNYSFVQYQMLDIDQNPQDQGYDAHSYDVIIASNSLHRAQNIETTLAYMQSLLAPGGLLLLLEMTRNSRLQQISTGFLEAGFTRFEDERQAEHSPLLSVEKWQNILQSKKFAEVVAFPGQRDPTNIFGQQVIVAQAPQNIKRFRPEKLSGFLSQKLPEYMIPAVWIPLTELPLTSNGKVNRQALPTPDIANKVKQEKAFLAPRTPIEQSLAAIWCQILEMEQIDITDNFFQLGGDSLLATKLSAMVRNKLEVELSLGSIFEGPTIAELAECVQALIEKKAKNSDSVACLPQIVPVADQWHLPFPLTDIQQAYWIGRSGVYSLGNVATHCYFEIEGIGLDIKRLNRAWQRLIDHHGMMRAVVLPDGQHQKILEQVPPYQIEIMDLRGKGSEDVETGLRNIREEMSHQVRATDKWPLFDVLASRFGENRVRLHISFDNLFFDGWSMFHLLSEWTRLYHDPDGSLASFDLSFRDYVLALERLKESDLYQRAQEYWFNRLPSLPPAPELPLAQNPSSVVQQRFSRLDAKLNRKTWQEIKKRSAKVGLTPSGILLTAYAEVLGIWSKSSRFTINLTQFNRLPLHPQVNDIIGDFTSLTLLAVDNSLGKTFLERGRLLQQQLWQDLDYSYVGGIQVQRELAKKRGEYQGVAMPVVFTSALGVDQWSGDDTGKKWLGKLVYNITQTPQVWLDHQVVEQDGELLLIWDAVAGLFPEGLLDDMFAAYCKLLQRLADEERAWREPAPSLIAVPRLEKRVEANHTDVPVSSATLTSLFEKQVVRQADYPAVISSGRTLTYGELSYRSAELGNLLREKGARPNTLVAVVMEKGWEQVVAVLGILKSGAAYLPIDPANPEERRWQLLRDGDIRIVLTQSWLEERLSWPKGIGRLFVDQVMPRDKTISPPELAGKPEDLAYVIYTSGSTGFPKGVMIDHRGAVNTILDVNKRFSVGPEDRVLALSNLNFDLSVYDIFGILAAGATIIMPEADKTRDPSHWLELMKQEQVTVWNTVPALMQMLLEYASGRDEAMPQSLRLVLLSGDWIPLDLADRIKAQFQGVQVIGLGGATEAAIWSNLYPIQEVDPNWKSVPYGRPMVNQRYHVLNEFMMDCPVWVPGQLYIGGIGLAKGYWNDETKTKDKFIHHPHTGERLYCTGDVGRYLPDGNIEFLGREDFQVKIRGHRIELGEIETALKRHDGVKDAVVAVSGKSSEEKHLVAYVVLNHEKGAELFETEHADPVICASRWQAIQGAGQLQASQIPHSVDIEAISVFMDYAERLSFMFICNTLYNMGIFSCENEGYSIDELMRQCKIHSRYHTLVLHWLNVLIEEGVLERNEAGIYLSRRSLKDGLPDFTPEGKLKLSPHVSKEALALDAFFRRDSSLYMGLLRGEIDPLELFLIEDSFLTPEALSQFNLTQEYYTDLSREVFSTIVNSYPPDKEVRVLEIGTRAGSLTDTLVPLLPAGSGRYLYADESSFFTDRARRKLGEGASLEYGLFDMNKTPLRQGYEPHSFDVIVADNTLHRTRNIETTLEYLKEMLVPGGFLFFIEATRNRRLMLTTVGFFEDGFSHLEDERKTNHLPLITVEKWRVILAKKGFTKVMAFPEAGHATDIFDQHLMVVQAPEAVRGFKPAKLSEAMRRKLPDYMVPAMYVLLDELPLSANGKVDRQALAELGREKASLPKKTHVAPSTEAQVKIANVWKEVLGCKDVGIHNGFFELGGDSLRAIQCINLLKERYQIDLSLQNLFEAPSIDLLARIIEAGAPAIEELAEHYEEGMI
jgi:yersiniabactin nonribosomal peptide synthetase